MASVSFRNISCTYDGNSTPAVDCLNLDIEDGEFMVLVGPSGCGKTTSLRLLAGLETAQAGTITIDGRDVTDLPPKDRDIAMVFQSYALYPHMSVEQNMGFALKMAHMAKHEIGDRVADAARLLDLNTYLERKPKALSGGQRQRVAMGRAIVRQPQVFLMDEPLSNLDAKLRVQTRTQISQLQRRLGVTTVYVTHDQTEAMTMGDRVAVMKDGVLQQLSTPEELYVRPANVFVAGFIGSPPMNLWPTHLVVDGLKLGDTIVPVPEGLVQRLGGTGRDGFTLGVRPEDFVVAPQGSGIPVRVEAVEVLGADTFIYGSTGDREGGGRPVVARLPGRVRPALDSVISVTFPWAKAHIFDATSGHRVEVESPTEGE
jgi:multiple sugar transport system ATP-binding protein